MEEQPAWLLLDKDCKSQQISQAIDSDFESTQSSIVYLPSMICELLHVQLRSQQAGQLLAARQELSD